MQTKLLSLLTVIILAITSVRAEALPPIKAVLFPIREATIAARTDSTLEVYGFRVGDEFPADAELARLDDRRFAIELRQAEEQFDFIQASYQDQKRLHEKNFTSDYELKKKEYEFKTAQNNLAETKLKLSFCTISAPFAGRIEEIITREHETVRAGQPLLRIIADHQLLAVMHIPVGELPKFAIDTEVNLSLPENQLTAKGKVYEIMPRADHRSGTIQIKVLIENSDRKYTAGMTGVLLP